MSLQEQFSALYSGDYTWKCKHAFMLGIYWDVIPAWAREDIQHHFSWDGTNTKMELNIVADSPTSWHDSYRSFRNRGWERVSAKREGGLITYILEHKVDWTTVPEEYAALRLLYQVSLPTCRQVKVGTKEVDVFETVCDDIQEPTEENDDEAHDDIPF